MPSIGGLGCARSHTDAVSEPVTDCHVKSQGVAELGWLQPTAGTWGEPIPTCQFITEVEYATSLKPHGPPHGQPESRLQSTGQTGRGGGGVTSGVFSFLTRSQVTEEDSIHDRDKGKVGIHNVDCIFEKGMIQSVVERLPTTRPRCPRAGQTERGGRSRASPLL